MLLPAAPPFRIVARLMQDVGAALQGHVDTLIDDVKRAIGAPVDEHGTGSSAQQGGSARPAYGASNTSSTGYGASSQDSASSASYRAD